MVDKIDWKNSIRRLIIDEINARGSNKFASTRAIYYWLGSMNLIPLIPQSYKALNALTVDMRQKGEIPWGYFPVLRGMNGTSASSYIPPETQYHVYCDTFLECDRYYQLPRWLKQKYHVEVWVEKVGMLPNVENAVRGLDVQCRSVGGFPPWEFVYDSIESIQNYMSDRASGAEFVILYLGDLDPSGRDIARQLMEALEFFDIDATLEWVGILPEHVARYHLPELPLDESVIRKIHRDSRYAGYMHWLRENGIDREMFVELDAWNAVAPDAISKELRPKIERYFDQSIYSHTSIEFNRDREHLRNMIEDAKKKLGVE